MLRYKIVPLASCLLLLATTAKAAVKDIDVRLHNDDDAASKEYHIIFAARAPHTHPLSVTGHTFVIWREIDKDTDTVMDTARGLYTTDKSVAGEVRAVLGPVPGNLENDAANQATATEWLDVRVDHAQWVNSRLVEFQYNQTKQFVTYQLGVSDCIDFIKAVGASINLPMPERSPRWPLPDGYVEELENIVDADVTVDLGGGYKYIGQSLLRAPNTVKALWPYGTGVIVGPGGYFAKGRFRVGRLDGPGEILLPGGPTLIGLWANGDLKRGTFVTSGGVVYTGELRNGVPQGTGTATLADGRSFSGSWSKGGLPDANLAVTMRGYYQGVVDNNGLPNGSGVDHVGGITASGTWQHGKFAGPITVTLPSGDQYTTTVSPPSSHFTGPTIFRFRNGDTSSGSVKDGIIQDGPSVITASNGSKTNARWAKADLILSSGRVANTIDARDRGAGPGSHDFGGGGRGGEGEGSGSGGGEGHPLASDHWAINGRDQGPVGPEGVVRAGGGDDHGGGGAGGAGGGGGDDHGGAGGE